MDWTPATWSIAWRESKPSISISCRALSWQLGRRFRLRNEERERLAKWREWRNDTHAACTVRPAAVMFHFGDQFVTEPLGHDGEPKDVRAGLNESDQSHRLTPRLLINGWQCKWYPISWKWRVWHWLPWRLVFQCRASGCNWRGGIAFPSPIDCWKSRTSRC